MKKNYGFEDDVFYWKCADPIYGVFYFVLISQSDSIHPCDKLINKYNPEFPVEPDQESKGYCWSHVNDKGQLEIYLGFRKKSTPSIKAHESLHAKNFVFHHVGIKPDADNDEPEAYYVGFVTGVVDLAFQKMTEELKKKFARTSLAQKKKKKK